MAKPGTKLFSVKSFNRTMEYLIRTSLGGLAGWEMRLLVSNEIGGKKCGPGFPSH